MILLQNTWSCTVPLIWATMRLCVAVLAVIGLASGAGARRGAVASAKQKDVLRAASQLRGGFDGRAWYNAFQRDSQPQEADQQESSNPEQASTGDAAASGSRDASFKELRDTAAELGPAVLEGVWCLAVHCDGSGDALDKLTAGDHALLLQALDPLHNVINEGEESEKLASLRADALKVLQAALPAETVEEISRLTSAAQDHANNADDSSGSKSDTDGSSERSEGNVCSAASWKREINQVPAKTAEDLALVLAVHASNAVSYSAYRCLTLSMREAVNATSLINALMDALQVVNRVLILLCVICVLL
jgi:hypothetical protein